VSSVEENLDETREAFMEGEEITYEMAESTIKKKEPTLVGVAEDHQSEEEEEEIFLEVREAFLCPTCGREALSNAAIRLSVCLFHGQEEGNDISWSRRGWSTSLRRSRRKYLCGVFVSKKNNSVSQAV